MSLIVVSPLARIAEMAVRHKAREMISLLAANQDFHRPAVISAERHLKLAMNDITFAGTGDLIAPQELHVAKIIEFARNWDQASPLIVHCWMGVSRSPAAAMIAPATSSTSRMLPLRRAGSGATNGLAAGLWSVSAVISGKLPVGGAVRPPLSA